MLFSKRKSIFKKVWNSSLNCRYLIKFFQQYFTADKNEKNKNKKRRGLVAAIILGLLLLIGVGIGAGIGIQSNSKYKL